MADYLQRFDAAPQDQQWPLARRWLLEEPLPFFAQLRAERPVLVTAEATLATRYADCDLILRRHETFGVDLYKPKQGKYWMAQGDTAEHWREKSVMRAILDREDVPDIRDYIAGKAGALLAAGRGKLEVVANLTRATPVALAQDWFGFDDADPQDLTDWSYWNQQDAFHNQPFDHAANSDEIILRREASVLALGAFLAAVTAKRALEVKLGSQRTDPVSRLLRLAFGGGVKFGVEQVISNVAGLLVGAVETTSHCTVNALQVLFARPDVLAAAKAAAIDPQTFDGFVFEALRFQPAFPYFFRTSRAPTVLARGTPFATDIPVGATVLAITHSAMFDEAMFEDPECFDPKRGTEDAFTFGAGLHECLGRAIGQVMVPEIVRQCLLLPDVKPAAPAAFRSGVPDSYTLTWAA